MSSGGWPPSPKVSQGLDKKPVAKFLSCYISIQPINTELINFGIKIINCF